MERFLLPVPSKRSRNSDLVRANETESIHLPQPKVDNSSDVNCIESDTEQAVDTFAGDAGTAVSTTASSINISITSSSINGPIMDLSQKPDEGTRRPIRKYPAQMFGNQQRSFQSRWFDQFDWLEYSVEKDAAFSFSCRHFAAAVGGHGLRLEPSFTNSGFQNWRKAQQSFKAHNASAAHKFSMEAWCEFKQRVKDGSKILNIINKGHSKVVEENRRYMKAVVESLRYTACQGIAQRGHREDEHSTNRGNFVKLLNVISMFDKTVAKKIAESPSNAKYTHHEVQNEIITIMADMIRKQISDEVGDAGYFALIVDEIKDISKKEQISVVIRYLHAGNVMEEFLNFTPAEGLERRFTSTVY